MKSMLQGGREVRRQGKGKGTVPGATLGGGGGLEKIAGNRILVSWGRGPGAEEPPRGEGDSQLTGKWSRFGHELPRPPQPLPRPRAKVEAQETHGGRALPQPPQPPQPFLKIGWGTKGERATRPPSSPENFSTEFSPKRFQRLRRLWKPLGGRGFSRLNLQRGG
jgi:hypothetical protein